MIQVFDPLYLEKDIKKEFPNLYVLLVNTIRWQNPITYETSRETCTSICEAN